MGPKVRSRSIPTWPLKVPGLRGVSVTAVIPLVTGLVTAGRAVLAGN